MFSNPLNAAIGILSTGDYNAKIGELGQKSRGEEGRRYWFVYGLRHLNKQLFSDWVKAIFLNFTIDRFLGIVKFKNFETFPIRLKID